VDRAIQAGAAMLEDRRSGQASLFDDDEQSAPDPRSNLPNIPEWEEREKLGKEREVLGYYRSSHPLAEHATTLRTYTTHTTGRLVGLATRTEVLLGGMLSALKYSHTKNARAGSTNTKYVMFDLEDLEGIVRCILWPEQFAQYEHLVEADAILGVVGKIDRRPGSDEFNVVVDQLLPLEELAARSIRGVRIHFYETRDEGLRGLERLHEILRLYPGSGQLRLILHLEGGEKVLCECDGLRIEPNDEMQRRVEDLLGPESYRPIIERRQAAPPAQNGRRQFAAV